MQPTRMIQFVYNTAALPAGNVCPSQYAVNEPLNKTEAQSKNGTRELTQVGANHTPRLGITKLPREEKPFEQAFGRSYH